MKILITGANGMLGKDLASLFESRGHAVIKTDRKDLDITSRDEVLERVRKIGPDLVINAAAYNFVDKVEEPEIYPLAFAVNAEGPRNLAEASALSGIPFVHYSTDYVFAGTKPEGYSEEDTTGPVSKYGETKEAGERFVQEIGGKYYICRLSKIFGKPGLSEESKESFVALMLRLAETMPELNIVHEEVGSPGYTPDIAKATLELLNGEYEPGIYHIVNDGRGVTWHEFANEIFEIAGVNVKSNPVTSAEFPKPAERPKFAPLINNKLPKLRDRKEALCEFLGG
ncbi:dTDP-4-dehydrorhamnose reductase [Candidatus Uhrbacteria bacterium CG11_big_fil_rev_8_21_14_0_20_41_9]|nr:MAG: dTDP-4-dehydrorhamnose reductase [Candidatus Uhrbacteria bacterium CG11_big_fil_rev_8_21_14_0_20_41_9]